MFYEILCKNRIFILLYFFNKNILRNDVSAYNMRNVVYFYKNIFNDHSFDVLCII